MRVLLDENIPRKLKWRLADEHEVLTVPEYGWSGKKNGTLLSAAAQEFDVFVTMDRGLEYQQNLGNLDLAIVLLSARSNHEHLLPLVPKLKAALHVAKAGIVARVAA